MSTKVERVLDAFYNQPYPQYGDMILRVRESGGLSEEDQAAIEDRASGIDARTILRHASPNLSAKDSDEEI
jgi:hypothetical protein